MGLDSVEDDDVFSFNDNESTNGFNSLTEDEPGNRFSETMYASQCENSWSSAANNPFLSHDRRARANSESSSVTSSRKYSLVTPTIIPDQRVQLNHPQYASSRVAIPTPPSHPPPGWLPDPGTTNPSQSGASLNGEWERDTMQSTSSDSPVPELVTQLVNYQASLSQSLANLNIQGHHHSETNVLPPVHTSGRQRPVNGFYQLNGLENIDCNSNYPRCTSNLSQQICPPTYSNSLDRKGTASISNCMSSQMNHTQTANGPSYNEVNHSQGIANVPSYMNTEVNHSQVTANGPSYIMTSEVNQSNINMACYMLNMLLQQGEQASAPGPMSQASSVYPYNNRSLEEGRCCAFCKNNRETKEFYTTHVVKDSRGKVICPVLRKYTCPVCKATGDNAHTLRHCPVRKLVAMNPQAHG